MLMDANGDFLIDPDKVKNSKQLAEIDYLKADRYRTIMTTMIIGQYNCGAECEYLQRYHLSMQAYSKGYQLALDELGEGNPLTQSLHKNVQSLSAKKNV